MNKLDILRATVLDLDPDVIGITESWSHESILDSELAISGFQLFRCDRTTGNRGGGVLLYVRENLHPTEYHTQSVYGEHVWCNISDILIGVCYRSDNSAIVSQNTEAQLRNVLHEVCAKNVLIMGDFNYPSVNWSTYSPEFSAHSGTSDFFTNY